MPNKNGISLPTAFVPKEKSLKIPLGNNLFTHFEGICVLLIAQSRNIAMRKATAFLVASLLGRCSVSEQFPGGVTHSPLGKSLPLKLLTLIPGDQNWPTMKGLVPQGKSNKQNHTVLSSTKPQPLKTKQSEAPQTNTTQRESEGQLRSKLFL